MYITIFCCTLDINNTLSNNITNSDSDDIGRSTNNSSGDGRVFPEVIAAMLLMIFIIGIVITSIIIRFITKRKSISRSQQTARITIAANPQISANYTYKSIPPQSPTAQQHTLSTTICEETKDDQQSAICYAFHHDNEYTTAESTSNPSALPDKPQLPTVNSSYHNKADSAYITPDGSTNSQSISVDGNLSIPQHDHCPTVSTGAFI